MKRRPSRDINIFNLSMLDVICSGMGAFLILFILASQATSDAQTQSSELQEQLDRCRQELKDCHEEPCATRCPCDETCPCAGRCPCPATNCAQQCPCDTNCPCADNCPCDQYCSCPNPPPPFVAVLARWMTPGVDIDLHVTDPDGRTCSYRSRTACGGELVYDYERVGFTEIFLGRRIPTNDRWWTLSYHYYSGAAPTEILGAVYYAEGMQEIPPLRLGPTDNARGPVPIYKFKVNSEGRLQFAAP
jgi:hypothetical protein